MAQRVLGIDLGAHTVKVAELHVGFRSVQLVRLLTFEVAQTPGDPLQRSLAALAAMPPADAGDAVCVGVPGDQVLVRLFEIPFSDPRKVHAVVYNELADDIPWEIDDVVYQEVLPAGGKSGGKVLVGAALREDMELLLEQLRDGGVDPRQLCVAPASYGGLTRRIYGDETVVLLDIGHLRSNLSLLAEGRCLAARTISRGGHQVTEGLSQLFQLSYGEAERFKCEQALVADDLDQLEPARRRVAAATAEAIAPLVREVRRRVAMTTGSLSAEADRVVLCGGGSRLEGLDDYLAVELELPVERLSMERDPELAASALPAELESVGALSIALGLEYGRRQTLDLRRGELAYTGDRSFLRDKLLLVALSALALLFFAGFNVVASLHGLQEEREVLQQRLEKETQRVLGKAVSNPRNVSRMVKAGAKTSAGDIPTTSALDVLEMLSKSVPPADKVQLDVTRLDVKPGKTNVRGTADTRGAIGRVIEGLKKVDCFSEVASGRISEVGENKKQFSLSIVTQCF